MSTLRLCVICNQYHWGPCPTLREHGAARNTDPDTSHMAAAKARVSLLEYRTLEALDYYGSLSAKEIAVKISDKYEYHCDRSAITPRMSPLRIKELIITLPEIRDGSHLHHITEAGRTYLMKRMRRV